MNRQATALAGLFFLVAIGGGLFWFLTQSSGDARRASSESPAADRSTELTTESAKLVAGTTSAGPGSVNELKRDVVRDAEHTAAAELDGDPVTWTGRVRWAAGTPADERGEVLVLAKLGTRAPFWDREAGDTDALVIARAPIAEDGTFSVDTVEGDERWIDLSARYGYLDRPLALPRRGDPLELSPKLGAWIEGTARAPKGIKPVALAESAVRLSNSGGGMDWRRMMDANRRALETELDGRGAFELGGVPAGGYNLRVAGGATAPYEEKGVELNPGQKLSIAVDLVASARITGRVLGMDGAPLEGVRVRARTPGQRGWGGPRSERSPEVSDRTDQFGAFELVGLEAGTYELDAWGGPLLEQVEREVILESGQALDDETLRGRAGVAQAGVVRWPDGTPAAGTVIEVSVSAESMDTDDRRARWGETMRLRGIDVVANAEGRFQVGGLNPDYRYSFEAAWEPTDELEMEGLDLDANPSKVVGYAETEPREVNEDPLELTLELSRWLVGFVVDPKGEPVTDYVIRAESTEGGWGRWTGDGGAEETVSNDRGEFALMGLDDGEWKLVVEAAGFAPPADDLVIQWPEILEEEPPVIRLEPEAVVTATVVDPLGNVVGGAEVRDVTTGWRDRMQGGGHELSKRTDAYGNVTLEGLGAGRYLLAAFADGFAPSDPVDLTLAPGALESNLRLELTPGGRVEGTLFDEDGEVEGRMVMLSNEGEGGMENGQMAETDEGGRFEFDAVSAGKVTVTAMPSGRSGNWNMSLAGMESTTTEVIDNETVFVELGSPPADPITVTGQVTRAGESVNAEVTFIASGEDFMAGLEAESTDDDGRYSIVLDGPGTYLANARPRGRRSRAYYRTVEIAADGTVDFAIPDGAITGKVLEDGKPAAGVSVSVVPDGPLPSGALLGSRFDASRTNREGVYTISGLDPGTYRVSIGGSGGWGRGASAFKVSLGVEVKENETTAGVDFELESPGALKVAVKDENGQAAVSGALFVRDQNGVVLNSVARSSRTTDGTFSIDELDPGVYTVSFRGDGRASVESDAFTIRSGETTELEMRCEQGSNLIVKVVDGDGEPTSASIEVLDANGKAFHTMLAIDFGFGPPSGGWTPGSETYGPLPPGSYTVRAVAEDGRETKRKVKLTGRPERKLTVRLR